MKIQDHYAARLALATALSMLMVIPGLPAYASDPIPIGEGRTHLYVSPEGNDAGPGTEDNPFKTLDRARDAVSALNDDMRKDIVVNLLGGTYVLDHTFELDNTDSGTNGHDVIYRAAPGADPVISGGQAVTGWSLHDAEQNIYRADAAALETRQLYVNGDRAIRARSQMNPPGFAKTATGYSTSDLAMETWKNPSDVEVASRVLWKEFRCPVAAIEGGSITMQQPCWDNANMHYGKGLSISVQ